MSALRRYPVKSLAGEDLASCSVETRGLAGDRRWAVRDQDGKLGSGKTSHRFRRMDGLLDVAATYDVDVPVLTFPDGRVLRGDDADVHRAFSELVGRPVTLSSEGDVSHFDEGPVHLVSTSALTAVSRSHGAPVDWRHTRANLLVEWPEQGLVEHAWAGRLVEVGAEVVLRVVDVMPRCVMVSARQRDVPADASLLRTVTDVADGALGVWADVERPGHVTVGDAVRLS